jgi:GxxExxY protein
MAGDQEDKAEERIARLRHADKTFQLRNWIYLVRKKLDSGWNEETYHLALYKTIQEHNVPVEFKPKRVLYHRDNAVHTFEADLIVWDLIIVECKALPFERNFIGEHYAQVIHYLKFYGMDLGLLVNFAQSPVLIERVLWDTPIPTISENYDYFQQGLTPVDRDNLLRIRQIIQLVIKQYGLGYPETVYRRIIAIEASYVGLTCVSDVEIQANWNGQQLPLHATPLLLIDGCYLLHIRAMLDNPTEYDFRRIKTYLRSLGLKFGLVVNFGKQQAQIFSVQV